MVKVNLELDKLTSLFVSYHILCAPTSMTIKYNKDIFDNLSVTPEERGHYLTSLLSDGVTLDKTDSIRTSLYFPGFTNLDELLDDVSLPNEVKTNVKAFEPRFNKYFEKVKSDVDKVYESRQNEAQDKIDNIYDTAQELTGTIIKRPDELDV